MNQPNLSFTVRHLPFGRMCALAVVGIAVALACTLGTSRANAAFEIVEFSGLSANQDGTSATQASSHAYQQDTTVLLTANGSQPDGQMKDVEVDAPPGLLGNPQAVPVPCKAEQLGVGESFAGRCPVDTQVGLARLYLAGLPFALPFPLYAMEPASGSPARFAFLVLGVPIFLDAYIRSDSDYGVTIKVRNISQATSLVGAQIIFWGVPADPSHDEWRLCPETEAVGCSSNAPEQAFLSAPANCAAGPQPWHLRTRSWQEPGVFKTASFTSDTNGGPTAVDGCERVPFTPAISAQPTTETAASPTGLDFTLDIPDAGFLNPDGLAQSYVKKAVVTLPEGMSINPSAGEGLGVCTPSDFAREEASSALGAGCPHSSKIGTVSVTTPVLKEPVAGSLYIAQQDDPNTTTAGAENPFDSLLALYVVAKVPERGILVKVAGNVSPDPETGQLTTTFDDLPQLPFSQFNLRFREGQRAPLVSPLACGRYQVEAQFTPWSAANPDNPSEDEIVRAAGPFKIDKGVSGGPCATSNANRPFNPGLQAGTLNNNAGSYSPANIRMTRNDGEQEITSFSADLPPGLVGKLAGVAKCSDAAIEAAKQKTGRQENARPSCSAASQVGKTLAGAGVGSVLAYAPGKVYLAGPYHGSPLSVAAITSATVGPFDLGTVVVRSALRINPETAQVSVDAAGSDPIPHILRGIPLHVRDIRVYVDRPEFTLNPTSCDRMSIVARLTGTGQDFVSPLDDAIASPSNPFQAANCAALPFKPKLSFKLRGGTKRGQFPAFQATLKARPGDANLAKTTVVLPRSEFIEQGHIRTVCTRVQFKAQQCPAGSIYGHARAITPLFDTPVEGPVYLRANGGERVLPDLVVSLKNGEIEVALAGFVDSVKGRVRNAFNVIPDAPVTKFTLNMLGGRKGLLVNHLDLCKVTSRAEVKMVGQNGKVVETRPKMGTSCGGKGRRGKR